MHTFLSGLVALALLVHAVCGCCLHHAHANSPCDHGIALEIAGSECCEHTGAPAEGNLPQSPCDGERGCHGVCNYLPTPKTQFDRSHELAAIDFATTLPQYVDAQLFALCSVGAVCEPHSFEPPLRLHLWHQHLLI
jgi:hypothetical protein